MSALAPRVAGALPLAAIVGVTAGGAVDVATPETGSATGEHAGPGYRRMLMTLRERWPSAEAWIVLLGALLSIASYAWYSGRGLTLVYLDSISHMTIARHVFASQAPGLAQLGTVWLPLNHILMLPLVWNGTLFQDGLAGTFPSMVAYVVAGLYMYRMACMLFDSALAGWCATLVLLLNPSVVYMQATPMSEMDLLCFAVIAVYYVLRWSRSFEAPDLVKAALATAAGTLVRYDGWALAAVLVVMVAFIALRRSGKTAAEANTLLFGLLALAGCAAWVIYQQVIFGNALDFLSGPYSAASQEQHITTKSGLPTYHNPLLAIHIYAQAVLDTAGWPIVVLAALGLLLWLAHAKLSAQTLPALAVLVPFAFNCLSLVLGITVIETPEVPLYTGVHTYFNVRYGLMMVPAMAIFLAYLAVQRRVALLALSALILVLGLQGSFLSTPYVLQDPLNGVNSQGRAYQQQEAAWLDAHYQGGTVLLSGGSFTPMLYYSQLPQGEYVSESDGSAFTNALAHPQAANVNWILMDPQNNNFDPVWSSLGHREDWHKYYALRTVIGSAQIYQRIGTAEATR